MPRPRDGVNVVLLRVANIENLLRPEAQATCAGEEDPGVGHLETEVR